MHPGTDDFISCSKDNTVRLWNTGTKHATGIMHLNTPFLSAFDPSGQVFAIGSPSAGHVLIYDHRNFDKAPVSMFDIVQSCGAVDADYLMQGWTTLEFSNDGKTILLGTKGAGHFLLDSFDGHLRAYLQKPEGRTNRLAAGEEASSSCNLESSGDCCLSPDGRFVLGGTNQGVVVWDTLAPLEGNKMLRPVYTIEDSRQAAVVAYNPRFNFLATADQDVVFWLPDPHA